MRRVFEKHTAARKARVEGDVDALLVMLADTDRVVRLAAVANLGDPRFTRAIPALLRCLQSRDENLRVGAVNALADVCDRRAVGHVLDVAANDDGFMVRIAAMSALARLGDRRVIPLIRAALKRPEKSPHWTRRWAADKLAQLRAVETIPDLEEARHGAGLFARWHIRQAIRQLNRLGGHS
jgi:HEAT repeat protein